MSNCKSDDSEEDPADFLETVEDIFHGEMRVKMEKKDFDYSAESDYEVLFEFVAIYGGELEKPALHCLWGQFCDLQEKHNQAVEAHNYLIDKVEELELVISKLESQ